MNTANFQKLTDRPDSDIILQRDGVAVTIRQFLAGVEQLTHGLPQHRYVINLHRNRHRFLQAFCATTLAGQCTLMPPNRQEQTLRELQSQFPDSYQLGGDETSCSDPAPDFSAMPGLVIPEIPLDQLCAIAFTSGSTGQPSPNYKTWKTLHASTQANGKALLEGWTGRANLLATVPSQHMWGFETSVLMPLFFDLAISAANPLYPQDIAAALDAMPAPRMLVSSPLHLQALMKSGVMVPELARVFSATAPLPQEMAQTLERYFSAPLIDVFGSSETGTIAVRRTATENLWRLSAPFELTEVEQQTRVTAAHLPAAVPMADRVEIVSPGQFRWISRQHDQVNVAGKRASLADLNRRLLAVDGVQDGVIFETAEAGERLAALVVAPGLTAREIRMAMQQDLDPVFLPRPIAFVASLPRSGTGKLPLSQVHTLFRQWRAEQAGKLA